MTHPDSKGEAVIEMKSKRKDGEFFQKSKHETKKKSQATTIEISC